MEQGTFTYEKKKIILLLVLIIMISAVCGSIFGFMSGGIMKEASPVLAKKFPQFFSKEKAPTVKQEVIQEDSAVISVVEKAAPAVVSIIVSKDMPKIKQYSSPFDFFSPFFAPEDNTLEMEKQKIGGGSGFVITDDGMIVTNKHVVSDPQADYTVITNDNKEFPARVLARDPQNDIAIIKVDTKDFPTLNLGNSDSLRIGQTVIAIGNSLGEFSNTVSRGIVSGLRRNLTATDERFRQTEQLTNIIQTDAAINPGNSGGPLLDISGDVIGVNVAIAQGAQNIGFALPANQIKKVIDQVKTTGKISIPYLGVRYMPIDKTIQDENQLPYNYGALVIRGEKVTDFAVIPGSPADKAGITENSIILEMDGIKLDQDNSLTDIISKKNVGDEVVIKFWQKGKELVVKARLEEKK